MKKTILLFVAFIGLLTTRMVSAQGTIYLSNLDQPPGGGRAVASDSWIAQRFQTGTNLDGYVLNSIRLPMNQLSGSPSGFSASLYTSDSGSPGSSLGSLSGLDPLTSGVYTFATSNVSLSLSTQYYVVLTAATPVATGSYSWSQTSSASYTSSDGWSLAPFYFASTDGSTWQPHRLIPFQFAVDATAVPEPESWLLVLLGLAGFDLVKTLSCPSRARGCWSLRLWCAGRTSALSRSRT